MTDFLLELRSEEIPARMQEKARADLERLFAAELAKSGLAAAEIITYATPRRLALIARDLPGETAAVSEEIKGPRANAPEQALEGFLRKTGLTRDQLTERDGVLYAITEKPGRAAAEVLAEAIPAIVRAFPWPKSMRWGAASASTESLRWVRPLQGIVALLGEDVVPCEIVGVQGASAGKVGTGFPSADATLKSSAATVGHRFHHPGVITIGSAHDYVEKLRACHVVVDGAERRRLIADGAAKAAADAGLELIEDEGLLYENAGLTEWPVPLLGRFDEAFLTVPPEVIQLTARVNQKYFVLKNPPPASPGEGDHPQGGGGGSPQTIRLANAFICTANIDATDGGKAIVEGNQKVLAARLSDARFFWDQDLKVPLDEQAKKLGQIVFHEKLGTVADKVDRVAKLARWLVEEGIIKPSPLQGRGRSREAAEGEGQDASHYDPASMLDTLPLSPALSPEGEREHLAALAERAARLAKADLVTGMVGEFPELQGVMGGYYAAAQGEDPQVAAAIRDHYKPVGQGDEVPTDPVTVAVSLADKLDTLSQFFIVEEFPTGSRDPFALRRAGLGALALLQENNLRVSLRAALFKPLLDRSMQMFAGDELRAASEVRELVAQFSDPERGESLYLSMISNTKDRARSERDTWFADKILGTIYYVSAFLADRLKVQQREAGVRHDLIDAVFALGGEDDLVRLLARVHALQAFMATADGANLLAGYKRAANILKKEGWETQPSPLQGRGRSREAAEGEGQDARPNDPASMLDTLPLSSAHSPEGQRGKIPLSYTPEPAENALIAALDSAAPRAEAAIGAEDFEGAMAALATLRAPIDAFFDSVTVNDPDPARREARLNLLARMRDAVHSVADFSKIEG
ncbi:glycine--tRNA ligase subunit beta [Sphingomonas gilva]|uniref:Glycine--tRNA ligase beta subunit n=1 Tax=Sphingomonas gilva TaxID=2305907 RepID=A0A396RSL1_9SPHN|nr:glycine--tRNA ligase subunit beta [Sphingomonas gilva]RHW17333.1 glycine--tRNA ligase subunit beta [Sphingomonas gilva]